MTPEPSVEAGCSRGNWSPKKKRNRGSSVSRPCGRATDALENILTTAGMALCAGGGRWGGGAGGGVRRGCGGAWRGFLVSFGHLRKGSARGLHRVFHI